MNTSDACYFLCVCKVQDCTMETMDWRDDISPSHINYLGMMGRVCLCVFTLGACCVPDGSRDKGRGKERRENRERHRLKHNLSAAADTIYSVYWIHNIAIDDCLALNNSPLPSWFLYLICHSHI